jgi:hypothetical protein
MSIPVTGSVYALDQKADSEHGQRRDIADKGDAERGHRYLEPTPRHPHCEPASE